MRIPWIGVAAVAAAALDPAHGLEITAIEKDGMLRWVDPYGNGTYAVEWGSSPGGPWRSWQDAVASLTGIDATGGKIAVSVPMFYRVGWGPPLPEGMALIPGGTFTMGDSFGEIGTWQVPLHQVPISTFHLDTREVTKALWDEVYAWAVANGYTFDNPGSGKGPDHPVQMVNWYDVVKWCNARSQKEGLAPVYTYLVLGRRTLYRTGQVDLANDTVEWDRDGYRLPTEAEWEYAARGGAEGRRFPWVDTDTITHNRANYRSYWEGGQPHFSYDVNPVEGFHALYDTEPTPYTSAVASFAPNGYGLYDMAGNVGEWCWDWFAPDWYEQEGATLPDPKGPADGDSRVVRGGSWLSYAPSSCCAARGYVLHPSDGNYNRGFRCARGF